MYLMLVMQKKNVWYTKHFSEELDFVDVIHFSWNDKIFDIFFGNREFQ